MASQGRASAAEGRALLWRPVAAEPLTQSLEYLAMVARRPNSGMMWPGLIRSKLNKDVWANTALEFLFSRAVKSPSDASFPCVAGLWLPSDPWLPLAIQSTLANPCARWAPRGLRGDLTELLSSST
jgi:hypothetical protein